MGEREESERNGLDPEEVQWELRRRKG